MQDVMGRTGKVMVDVEGGNNMMYLPLDRLTSQQPLTGGSNTANRNIRLDDETVRQITDQVLEETRKRTQSTSGLREGR